MQCIGIAVKLQQSLCERKKPRTDPHRSSLAGRGGDDVCACEGMHSDPLAAAFKARSHTYELKRKPRLVKFKHVRINKNNPHRLQPGALKLCVSLLFQYGSKCPEEEQPAKEGFKLGKARFSQQEAAACTPGLAPLQRPERPKPDPKNNGWLGL